MGRKDDDSVSNCGTIDGTKLKTVSRSVDVPITPSVMKWAIDESGYSMPEVSEWIDGGPDVLQAWLDGEAKPSLTELKTVARKLHRQLATFLLPNPPETQAVAVRFRHPQSHRQRPLNPIERRFIRRAHRLQDAHGWLSRELGSDEPDLARETTADSALAAATRFRARLAITTEQQTSWRSASVAFDAWREAVEQLGIIVVLFPMTDESCRGFSLWHDHAPLVAVNTAWKDEARIFTLFHEIGHILTRIDSACALANPSIGHAEDAGERWCESFAASVIIPEKALTGLPKVSDLKSLARLSDQFKVSLRAMAIRLIGAQKATWSLYKSIPVAADDKGRGGAGGTGRNRREIREDEFGHRGTRVFVEAVRRDVITESQALDYLDIPVADFDRLAQSVPIAL